MSNFMSFENLIYLRFLDVFDVFFDCIDGGLRIFLCCGHVGFKIDELSPKFGQIGLKIDKNIYLIKLSILLFRIWGKWWLLSFQFRFGV